ncbi:hypothetical protein VKT23_003804 [Stygiomarasmius scandens]|uniref:Uncharacterized protein n=1 Tax=Marasmiellus scandens TaxID=2682957 RepID=A0ABR1K2M6_9AGAR
MDDQFLLRVFDAIGALKEEPSKLQSLAFDSCQFETVLPTSSPYDVKFSSLHLRLGVNESIETLIHAFKIHGLHGFTATNLSFFRGADTYALATLLNRSRQELQFISLARLDPPSTYDKWGALRNVHFSEMICLTDFFLSQSGSSSSILSHIIEEVTRATALARSFAGKFAPGQTRFTANTVFCQRGARRSSQNGAAADV